MYKLIRCLFSVIFVCLFIVGSLSFAQGLDPSPSGWEQAHKEALAKVEAAKKDVMAKVEKEAMAEEATAKAEQAMVKADEAMAKAEEAMAKAHEAMAR